MPVPAPVAEASPGARAPSLSLAAGSQGPLPLPPVQAPAAAVLNAEMGVLRQVQAENRPAMLPPVLGNLSAEQLWSMTILVMEEWRRREAVGP